MIKDKKLKLFEFEADYNPNHKVHPRYYVCAYDKKDAKRRMADVLSHMKIYDIHEVEDQDRVKEIVTSWGKYICNNEIAMMRQEGWSPKKRGDGVWYEIEYEDGTRIPLEEYLKQEKK